MRLSSALRSVAVLEAFKGALVLLTGLGLLSLVHRDVHDLAAQLIRHAHLNPASRYPRIFLDLAAHLDDSRMWLLAIGAAAYACLRLVEAYGLWYEKAWAEWLAALSGGLYVPIEIFELFVNPGWLGLSVMVVNLLVVALMVKAVRLRRQAGRRSAQGRG